MRYVQNPLLSYGTKGVGAEGVDMCVPTSQGCQQWFAQQKERRSFVFSPYRSGKGGWASNHV